MTVKFVTVIITVSMNVTKTETVAITITKKRNKIIIKTLSK